MKVRVEEGLFITSDADNFMVAREKNGKNGKSLVAQSYHTSLEAAVQAVLRIRIKQSKATTLQELLIELKQIRLGIERKVGI